MSNFEVGDTVWCLIQGKGVVVGIHEDASMHPVYVDFPDIGLRGERRRLGDDHFLWCCNYPRDTKEPYG